MAKEPKRFLVTSALPYANGPKHIGHLAGAYLPADIYVRYLRASKKDVVYVCGSDEHGAAITMQAIKEKTTPRDIVDKYHALLKSNMEDLGISFDIYHRTSSPLHQETAQEFFTDLNGMGNLEVKETDQFFDEEAQSFLADRYITGTCPVCGNPNAFGDQCEKCGTSLSPDQLINPRSTLSGKVPVKKSTTHWFLPLQLHEDFLRKWILEDHKDDWKPNVLGQCKSWLDLGLQPRAVTRDLDWGVPVPLEEAKGKVLYVWFDAPIGYISATKQWALDNGKDWKPYWHDADTKLVHFIGKDNIVFHAIIFPVMLKLHGNILPENVPSNEFMNLEGDKMSTSRGWSIEMDEYIEDFVKPENGGNQLVDSLRYYLTAIAPETKDSEFTWKGFQEAVNSDLVGKFGNFVNRTFVLMHKLCKGKVPPYHQDLQDGIDEDMFLAITNTKDAVEKLLKQYKFRDALFEVIMLADAANKYMQKKEPWIVARSLETNTHAQLLIDNCIHVCLQVTANLAIFINPFLPGTAAKMCHMMKVVADILHWENAGKLKLLSIGYSLRAPELLFRKIEDEEVARQVEKLNAKQKTLQMTSPESEDNKTHEPRLAKPEIVYDDFAKIELRAGIILSAEKVPKADKLLQLSIDLGTETRTILSGIAMHFDAGSLAGKRVVVVTNLAPRKMKGIESNGMILLAENKDGTLKFIEPAEGTENGATIS